MSDDLVKRLREVIGNKLDYTTTPNHLLLTAADRIEELEAKLAKAVDGMREYFAATDALEGTITREMLGRAEKADIAVQTLIAELKGDTYA